MRRAQRVCRCTGCPAHQGSCPTLVDRGRCAPCGQQHELRRGRRQARGYDTEYDQARRSWAVRVARGGVHCHAPRCLMPARLILPGQTWDLGHDEQRRIRGPEHQLCNRSAGGKAAHGG